jgi:hypothetical protein
MWSIDVKFDPDNDDVVNLTATWTETVGEFSKSFRVSKATANVNDVLVLAIKERNEWQRKNALNASIAVQILTKINAVDPQGAKT